MEYNLKAVDPRLENKTPGLIYRFTLTGALLKKNRGKTIQLGMYVFVDGVCTIRCSPGDVNGHYKYMNKCWQVVPYTGEDQEERQQDGERQTETDQTERTVQNVSSDVQEDGRPTEESPNERIPDVGIDEGSAESEAEGD